MVVAASASAAAAPLPQPEALAVARASLEFIRDMIHITRGDDELRDALIFTVALDANMAPVNRDPQLQVAYGGAEVSAPDDLRRPVSINAVAKSLRLPFETVRRRFQRMASDGLCIIGPQGVLVPRDAVTSAGYIAKQRARYDRARAFYLGLKAAGLLPPEGPGETLSVGAEPLVRAANRALSEYVLRACDGLVGLTNSMVTSLVLLELVVANTQGLTAEDLPAWAAAPERIGRPVRIAALATPWRLSGETIRRHLRNLEALDFCRRTSGGLVATAPASAGPRLVQLIQANAANLQRLTARLRPLGVLAAWDDD